MSVCECRRVAEEKLLSKLRENHPNATNHKVILMCYGIVFDKSGQVQEKPFMPSAASYSRQQKNGKIREVKGTYNIFFSYCPFCGKSLTDDEGAT